ncbi:MAG: ATP synthase F1 subunit gamma [Deltaproteobacteria bacterium]|nr:ATP synthase F1 subunit gamma [Candidatus Zymogenaceae bacterium]
MASLKDIRKRIQSVKNTQQITSAMKMVAASRLRRAQERIERARPYAEEMAVVLSDLAVRVHADSHPLLTRRPVGKVMLIVFTSDRGLCGGFNQNIIRTAERFIRENRKKYSKITFTIIGKKGYDYFRRRTTPIFKNYTGISGSIEYRLGETIVQDVVKSFLDGSMDEIYLLFNKFITPMTQEVVFDRLLPISRSKARENTTPVEYLFEPSQEYVIEGIIKRHLNTQVFRALIESEASELGARMTAMDSATSNAEEMIEKLTLDYNRARQEAITLELMEIVSGAEAL